MRDLHRVREREGIVLSTSQVYLLLGLLSIVACLVFIFGYYVGRHAPVSVAMESPAPLIPEDVERQTVALLLARAADEGAERIDEDSLDLEFHDVLRRHDDTPVESAGKVTSTPSAVMSSEEEAGKTLVPEARPTAEPPVFEASRTPAEESAPMAGPTEVSGGDRDRPGTGDDAPEAGTPGRNGAIEDGGWPSRVQPTPSRAVHDGSQSAAVSDEPGQGRRALSAPEAVPPEPSPRTTEHARAGSHRWAARYTVQVSSFKDSAVADRLVKQLELKGFAAYRVSADVNGMTWYRVRVGLFESKPVAEAESARLREARPDLKPMITRE